MITDSLSIRVGDNVTLGLGTHDFATKAWFELPAIGITHELEPSCSPSCAIYHEISSKVKRYDSLMLPCVKKPNHLKGKIMDISETDQGNYMVKVDFGTVQRWFQPYLINCPPLSSTGPMPKPIL